MKILFLTPPPYLLNRLHRIRSFDLIQILAKKHEVHLLSITTEKEIPEEFRFIKKICKSITIIHINNFFAYLNCLIFFYLPAEVAFCLSKDANREVNKIIRDKKIDLVYLKRLRSSVYVNKIDIPILLDTTDAMSMFYERLYKNEIRIKKLFYFIEFLKYKRYEKVIASKYFDWIVCSELDKKYLLNLHKSLNIHVVPNPVDTKYFKQLNIRQNNTILFRGLMDKEVNIDALKYFVRDIFPLIKSAIPSVKLIIVGPNPVNSIIKFTRDKNISVLGFVNDIRKITMQTSLSICPIRIGSGTRYKITQAWAMGQPIVSTTLGTEGLLYKNHVNIEIADTPKLFAKKVITLLTDKTAYNKLKKNGRETVEKYYSFDSISKNLNNLLKNVVQKE